VADDHERDEERDLQQELDRRERPNPEIPAQRHADRQGESEAGQRHAQREGDILPVEAVHQRVVRQRRDALADEARSHRGSEWIQKGKAQNREGGRAQQDP